MELRIARPMVFSDDSGVRAFVPGLTVEVDAATAERILAQRAGIAVAPNPKPPRAAGKPPTLRSDAMSVQIRFQYDDKLAQEALRAAPRQVPFAIALTLTRLAKKGQAAAEEEMRRAFDRPTPYTLRSLAIRPATKDYQKAEVFFRHFGGKGTPASKYILPGVEGDPRRVKRFERALQYAGVLPHGKMAYPGDGADLDAYGNMNRGQIVKILSYFRAFSEVGYAANRRADGKSQGVRRNEHYFVGGQGRARGYHPGVYIRKEGKAMPVLIFGRQASYQPIFAFYDVVRDTAAREFAGEFERAAREALATALP